MLLRGRDLNPEDTGDDVALLQSELASLGHTIAADERARRHFGATTREAVEFMQDAFVGALHELFWAGARGVVDVATATIINRMVDQRSARPAVEPGYIVSGTVTDASGAPCPAATVRVLDQSVSGQRELGKSTTDTAGAFQVAFEFRAERKGEARTSSIPAAPDLVFTVTDTQGRSRALNNVSIQDARGGTAVERIAPWPDAPFVIVNAPARIQVHLYVAEANGEGLSEFEEVEARLAPALRDVTYEQLKEGEGQFQVSFLAAETGIARGIIERLIASARASRLAAGHQGEVPLAVFYGLGHAQLPVDLAALGRLPRATLVNALGAALSETVIPRALANSVDKYVDAILAAGAEQALGARAPGGSSASAWLSLAKLSAQSQTALLRALAEADGATDELWKQLRDRSDLGGADVVKRVELVLKLATFTEENLRLVQLLLKDESLRIQSIEDVARLDETAWRALVDRAGLPDALLVNGHEPKGAREQYVQRLVRVAQRAYSTCAIEALVTRAHQDLGVDPAAARWLESARRAADAGSVPAFDLRADHVDRFVAEHGGRIDAGAADADRLRTDLKRLQRTLLIADEPGRLALLMKKGFDSALKVANVPASVFVDEHGADLGPEVAAEIHLRATQINLAHLFVHGLVFDALRLSGPMMLKSATPPIALADVVKIIPSYADLFGELSLCECDDCESVLSPAAYLVDLLQFLSRSAKNAAGKTPLDVLLERRPDLEHILLTCENSNTPLPAIDLVNEILETIVVVGKVDASAAHDTGTATAEELAANPQFTLEKARDTLAAALFPIRLPYDLRLETARAFLKTLGTSRYDVMRTLRQDALLPNPLLTTEEAIAAEALALSKLDFELITGMQYGGASATSGTFEDLYGLDAASLAPGLALGSRGSAVRVLQQKLNADGALPPLKITGELDAATQTALAAFQSVAGLPPTGKTTAATWAVLNGINPDMGAGLVSWVTEFMRRTERPYVDLVAVCATQTFNPLGASISVLGTTAVTWSDVAALAASGFAAPNPAIVAGAGTLGLAVADFVTWLKERFDGLAAGIVIESLGNDCDLDDARLRRIDGETLSHDTFIAINRFLRLSGRTGLSIPELDVVLCAFARLPISGTTDANLPLSLAGLLRLRERLGISIPDLAVLLGYLPTGSQSLYTQLFLNRAALALDASFGLALDGTELALTGETIDKHVPALLAAFRVTAEDLALIRVDVGLAAAADTLSIARLAALYRYPVLARALDVGVADVTTMRALSFPDPLQTIPDQPLRLERLVRDIDALAGAGLGIAVVDQLLRHVGRAGSGEATETVLEALGATLHDEQVDLAADIGTEPGMPIERFRTLLARLVGPEAVDRFLGIATGSATFTAAYAKTPTAAQIDAFAPNVTFEPEQQIIRFARVAMPTGSVVTLGALTDAEKITLQTAAAADLDLVQAVGILHARPRQVLADTLAGITGGLAVAAVILASGPGARDVESKLHFIVEALLPYIREALARALIKQEVLPFANLEAPTLAVLLEDPAVATAPGSADALIVPLRNLERGGWAAEFYTSTTLTGAPVATAEVDLLSYAGVSGDFGQATAIGSARWSAQFLPRAPSSIVFEVQTNGTPALSWSGVAVPFVQTGQLFRFELRTVEARERVAISLEWRRTVAAPAMLQLAWINGTDPRTAFPARLLVPTSIFTAAIIALTRLDKASRLLRVVTLDPALLRHAAAHAAAFFGFELDALPLARDAASGAAIDSAAPALLRGLLRLIELSQLAMRLRGEDALLGILTAPSIVDAGKLMAAALAASEDDTALLLGAGGFNAGLADLVDGRALLLVSAAVNLIRRVGISGTDLLAWATTPVDAAQSEDIKRATRARFDDADWLKLSEGLNDPLREQWRDALASWLLTRLGLSNRNQLFELLLLDTEVSSCVKTSRIRHAITAAQTWVQRVQLNLENFGPTAANTVIPKAIDAQIWEAKKYFRVQGAARRVFLYPENYMKELLRDNRTPLFDRFIGDLGQAELSSQGVETAFLNCLKGLDEVARMEICGAWAQGYDAGSREQLDLVHMIGRTTLGSPYAFHYRRLEADQHWSPWERVPIDVDTVHDGKVEGAHVVPVLWNRRLYVFWPILEVKPDEGATGQNPMREPQAHKDWRKAHQAWEAAYAKWQKDLQKWKDDKANWEAQNAHRGKSLFWDIPAPTAPPEPQEPDSTEAIHPQDTHMEIRIAWCEFFDGRWSAKQVSSLLLKASNLKPEQYVFSAVQSNDGKLYVEFICRHVIWSWVPNPGTGGGFMHVGVSSDALSVDRGTFVLSGINGRLQADSAILGVAPGQSGGLWIVQPDNTLPVFNTFELKPGGAGLTFNVGDYLPLNLRLISGSLINARREPLTALARSPSTYRLTPPHHYTQYVLQGPSFYQDFSRTYIVTRVTRVQWDAYSVVQRIEAKIPAAPSGLQLNGMMVTKPDTSERVTAMLERQQRIYSSPSTQLTRLTVSNSGVTVVVPASQVMSGTVPFTVATLGIKDTIAVSKHDLGSSTYFYPTRNYVLFRNLFHPHVTDFIRLLNQGGIETLLATSTQSLNNDGGGNRFVSEYQPTSRVATPFPLEKVDFSDGAYGVYNWELFFHAPMLMTDVYEAAGMFDDAERCLRYVLDPTAGNLTTAPGGSPSEFWQFLPFRGYTPARIQDLLTALSYTGTDPVQLNLKAEATAQIVAWERDPFNPYLIGRLRIGAFQKYVVIRWIQHLVLRADTLMRSDRPEPINEAVQVLVLAANMIGQRAERIPPRTRREPRSYATLKAGLDRFSNALVLLENEFPFSAPLPPPGPAPGGGLLGMSEALYFCIPPNDLLELLWDTIADRLFKIRHCMNIEGVVRDLPLYDPPIDPALLVAARTQGLDLASVLSDLGAPLPQHRFDVCLEQANQAVEDVRRLGQDLRAILEARDSEDLNVRRARQDLALLRDQVRQIKLREVDQAKAQIQVLEEAQGLLDSVRIPYFMRQLGLTEAPPPGVIADAKVLISKSELARVNALGAARADLADASQYSMSAKMMSAIPTMMTGAAGLSSPVMEIYLGGHMFALGLEAFAQMKTQGAADAGHQSTLAQIRAEVERRAEQWSLELSSAVGEREHLDKQLLATRIGLDLANFQLLAHDKETEFAAERLEFLENKPTALAHHEWLEQEVGLLLGQYYQLAFDLCKRTQQVYRFDTADAAATFVEFGYFDKAHHGLLSGERLALALRKMARAYRDQERYEYELSKPVSLALCDPMALVSLRATGACEFVLSEALFDADFPGHFMRRIRRVAITIPCVTGPYVNVNATLTLLNSRVRTNSALSPSYTERPDDPRFAYQQGVVRSVAMSHAQEDSGVAAEKNGARFDPFERFGAVSRWRLELPHDTNAFDPDTITDVILRVDYTAREGGDVLRSAVRAASLQPPRKGVARLFSMRHEFSNAWYRGLRPADPAALDQVFELDLEAAHFPYLMRARRPSITELAVMLQVDDVVAYQGGSPLQVEIVLTALVNGAPAGPPQSQVVTLQSLATRLDGLPMARVKLASKVPVRVQIKAKSVDVALLDPHFIANVGSGAALRHRLNSHSSRDLKVLVTYDTAV
jgi:hypothetical protein